jgi:hypothetical protein
MWQRKIRGTAPQGAQRQWLRPIQAF